jgi:hypothetical protein
VLVEGRPRAVVEAALDDGDEGLFARAAHARPH